MVEDAPPPPMPDMRPGENRVWTGPPAAVIASRTDVAANRHGELLAPLIDEVLQEAGAAASDLAAIGVGLGPGPFTGLRVGIVTAKVMGDALGIPTYGMSSLDVIGSDLSADALSHDGEMEHSSAVVTDARRKQVYWATYSYEGARLDGPEISPPAELAERLAASDIRFVGGAGAILYRDVFAGFTVFESSPYPSAVTIARNALSRQQLRRPSDELEPLYLRRPDARPPGPPKQVTPV